MDTVLALAAAECDVDAGGVAALSLWPRLQLQ